MGSNPDFRVALLPGICQLAGPMKILTRLFPLLPALCLVACSGAGGGEGEGTVVAEGAAKTISEDPAAMKRIKSGDAGDDDFHKMADKYGDYNKSLDAEGKPVPGAGKEFAGFKRDNPEFKGRWEGKEYKDGDYRKKSLWGDKDYVTKVYEGKTDANSLKKESMFGKKTAGEGSKVARDGNKSYTTSNYDTGRAREEGRNGIARSSDAETDVRRRVFTQPNMIPWQAQGAMTVEDTKRMLGR